MKSVDIRNETFRTLPRMRHFQFIDLFAGIGGMRIPFEEMGGQCVFTSEIDKFCRLTYQAILINVSWSETSSRTPRILRKFLRMMSCWQGFLANHSRKPESR